MADFKISDGITEKAEGGYSNVVGDKGGETYMGIARNSNPSWVGWAIIDKYKAAHGAIKNNFKIPDPALQPLVDSFYQKEYWDTISGDKISSQDVANIFYDMHVNSGAAVKIMKTVVTQMGKPVTVNNKFDSDTLTAMNALPATDLFQNYKDARKAYYELEVKDGNIESKFLDGLLKRVDSYFPDLKKKVIEGGIGIVGIAGIGAAVYFGMKLFKGGKV